jgi:hypothetical protein
MAAPFSPEPEPAPAPAADPPRPRAWQPFTPKGIAAFATAGFGRLFAFQVLVALLSGGVVVWFLWTVWFPIARESIGNLAGEGVIRAGTLELPGFGMQRLATNRFLTLAIDVDSDRRHDYSADVFMVLRRSHVDMCSLFGCGAYRYPVRDAAFTRLELEARWGAWQPFLLGIAGITVAFHVVVHMVDSRDALFSFCTLTRVLPGPRADVGWKLAVVLRSAFGRDRLYAGWRRRVRFERCEPHPIAAVGGAARGNSLGAHRLCGAGVTAGSPEGGEPVHGGSPSTRRNRRAATSKCLSVIALTQPLG